MLKFHTSTLRSSDISVTVQRDELKIKLDELNEEMTRMKSQCSGKRGKSNSQSESLLNVDKLKNNYFITSCVFFGSPCPDFSDFENPNTTGGWPDFGFPDDRPERNATERGYKALSN